MDVTHETELREQDKWLPIANVYRIMKNALPKNAKVSKEAKECVQECVSEFVSFITSEASDRCSNEKRKTVNGEDILFAMTSLGFENYAEVLKIYLTKYREYLNSKERAKRSAAVASMMETSAIDEAVPLSSGDSSVAPADPESAPQVASEAFAQVTDGQEAGLSRNDNERFPYNSFDGAQDDAALYDEYQGQFTNEVDMGQFNND